jgi:hypothetical protein
MPIPFTDNIYPNGDFGIVKDTDVAGGIHSVTTGIGIPLGRQKVGMLIYQEDTGNLYRVEAVGEPPTVRRLLFIEKMTTGTGGDFESVSIGDTAETSNISIGTTNTNGSVFIGRSSHNVIVSANNLYVNNGSISRATSGPLNIGHNTAVSGINIGTTNTNGSVFIGRSSRDVVVSADNLYVNSGSISRATSGPLNIGNQAAVSGINIGTAGTEGGVTLGRPGYDVVVAGSALQLPVNGVNIGPQVVGSTGITGDESLNFSTGGITVAEMYRAGGAGAFAVNSATIIYNTLGVAGAMTLSNTLGVSGTAVLGTNVSEDQNPLAFPKGAIAVTYPNSNPLMAIGHTGTTENQAFIRFVANESTAGFIAKGVGSAVNYVTSSDYRLKENISPLESAIDLVKGLKPVTFNFIGNDKTIQGFLAHEVQELVPQAVTGAKDAVDENGGPVHQGIDASKLVPLLTAAVKELMQKVEDLTAEVEALKAGD